MSDLQLDVRTLPQQYIGCQLLSNAAGPPTIATVAVEPARGSGVACAEHHLAVRVTTPALHLCRGHFVAVGDANSKPRLIGAHLSRASDFSEAEISCQSPLGDRGARFSRRYFACGLPAIQSVRCNAD